MDERWQIFFEKFPGTVTSEQLPVKLPRFDLDLCDLAGASADWCHQYLKDRKCPSDLIVFLTQKINNLRVQWAAEPNSFGFRPNTKDYQALWLMQRVIAELNEVCLNHSSLIPCHKPILTSVWWSSFVLKNARRQMEDYIAVVPYLHTLFDIKDHGEASFYAIYDGHNGLDAAVYSSMYLHQFLVQSVHYPTNPEKALYEAFFATDKGFTQKTEKYSLVSGTTAVCALYRPQEKKLYVAWAGDSIATLWKNGTPLCLVNKHVPERPDETERIENEGGMVTKCQGIWRVDGQLAVSRAIGDVKYKPHITCQPEIRALVLDGNEEFLVLCSDGLWEYTTPEDVAENIYDELLETDGDVSQVGNKLALKSKEQGSKDNISVITVFLQDPKLLVAKRRAVIMETAMEQRNATASLASYGQDTGDFGPETDVDTPDEPIGGLTQPKVEGEANVIDESGEDSEEDGGGWNYYKKSTTEDAEKKTYQTDDDNNTGNNSDAEDMDYKLNPDAPEFVPVSSPPPPDSYAVNNLADRFLNADKDDFISSSPQKFKESIDNVDVPDMNDFKDSVLAADLSTLNTPYEPTIDSTLLNGVKPLNEAHTLDETVDNFMFQHEHITNGNLEKYQNPFATDDKHDDKVDLNKVQDLSEYLNDNAQTYNSDNADPYTSIMETTPQNNEIDSTSGDNELQNESDIKVNDNFSVGEHLKYEQDMNSKNIDDTVNSTDATVGSNSQLNNSLLQNDDLKNEFIESNNIDKFGLYEDHKLNDSVSTTDAIIGSEPNTPMRMDNQSTFESENDEDQFSESFKQQLQFNEVDENNDKENHDPFCFDQTEDPAGIIPNAVPHELNEVIEETHHDNESVEPNGSAFEHQVTELSNHEPVEEPLCIREEAKPFHSVYEQQYLPESDFSASVHEALLNITENEFNNLENTVHADHMEQHDVESHVENKEEYDEHLIQEPKMSNYSDNAELVDSDEDEVKDHVQDLKQEFHHDNLCEFEPENNYENSTINLNENLEPEYKDEQNYVRDLKLENLADQNVQNDIKEFESHHQDFESVIEHEPSDVAKFAANNFVEDSTQVHHEVESNENDGEVMKLNYQGNFAEAAPIQVEDSKQDNFHIETVQNDVEDNIVETVQSHIDDFEQTHGSISEVLKNHDEDFKEEHNNFVEDVKNNIGDFHQDKSDVEPVENHAADSDEEMHSSMIIHSDVENNTPQPYCSSNGTLLNEPDMMCTSMTFEENFQNRNMSDSLYVMETSSDYFGEEIQQSSELHKSVDEPRVEGESSNIQNMLVEPLKIENNTVADAISELVSESKIEEVKAEVIESSQLSSQVTEEKVEEPEEKSSKVTEAALAAAVGAAGIAAVGASLASKKSAPKKLDTTVSKAKTASAKTTSTKPVASKTSSAPLLKKTTTSTTTSKPLPRQTTASATAKPTTNIRPATAPKTTTLKATTVAKSPPKLAPKSPASRPTSAKVTPTTTRTSITKTTPISSPKTTTTPKPTTVSKPSTPRTSLTQRASPLVSKQPLTNGSSKPLSRPISAPAKKPLSNVTTNGTSKLTNGDVTKTSTTTKPPVNLATRMSLAPPKLPPKVKVVPKTEAPPAMPGPIRRPKAAPITKKTETATS